MAIETHEAFIEKQRISDQLVEMFQAAGINATHRKIAGATWGDNLNFGKFEVRMGWQNCGSINEPWATLDTLSNRWLKPVGERAEQQRLALGQQGFLRAGQTDRQSAPGRPQD